MLRNKTMLQLMKKKWWFCCGVIVVLLCVVLSFSCCSEKYVDLDYLDKKYGMIIFDPILQDDMSWYLPLSVKTQILHSSTYVSGAEVKIRKENIFITLYIKIVSDKKGALFKGINLGKIKVGTYKIFYLNPDGSSSFIRDIEIK